LGELLPLLNKSIDAYGFDISWSRAACARRYFEDKSLTNVKLLTADMLNIPFVDNAFDVVYTSHAVEPNGGNEEEILKELYRITAKYLILMEPIFELASKEGQQRMEFHGYVKNLKQIACYLGYNIVEYKLFPKEMQFNLLNPTGLIVIEKNNSNLDDVNLYADPLFKTPLIINDSKSAYFSPDSLHVYPVLDKIPCLRVENGIIASKFEDYKLL
jgi:ubiquinone/menaquinone biosynthesis C-methylase UbiE